MIKRIIKFIIVLILPCIILLSGCWSKKEINTLIITAAIGIDKAEEGYLVTEQVINPKAVASVRSTNDTPVMIYSAKGSDLSEVIQNISRKSSRRIYSSHLRLVVLSEEVAKDGINDILDMLLRGHEYRTDFYFVVAKGLMASDVLNVLTPIESIPGVYINDAIDIANKDCSSIKAIGLIELINTVIAEGKNPVLPGVWLTHNEIKPLSTNDLRRSSGIMKPIIAGAAVFKDDKLIGWLTDGEAKGYNYIVGDVKRSVEHFFLNKNVELSFKIISAKSKIDVILENGKPTILVNLHIEQNIETVEGHFDVSTDENKRIMDEFSEKKCRELCTIVLKKAQNELKSDIFGFGEKIYKKYPKIWDELKKNWDNNFSELKVEFNIEIETKQTGQITKSIFIKEY